MKNKQTVLLAAAAAGLALLINQIIGDIYFRPRPFSDHVVTLLLNKSADPSFPSDHSTGAFALAFVILWRNRRDGLFLLVMAVILGFSRVYVGTHYPLDILGGALTGWVGAGFIKWQSERLEPMVNWLIKQWKQMEIAILKKE